MKLSVEELQRYHRHLILNEFGMEAQLKLKASKVLVVGAGGLGSPVLLYLNAAGVGTLGIVDSDIVDVTNLQRQVLFTEDAVGQSKASAASIELNRRNHHTNIQVHNTRLQSDNVLNIIRDYDVIIDGTDNFPTRYLLNDACVLTKKPLVYGSVLRFEGHVSVFNFPPEDETSVTYRDIFPSPPEPDAVPDCEQAGVIGILPGMIGCLQANEAVKILTKVGDPLAGKLLIFDALSLDIQIIRLPVGSSKKTIRGLIDYDEFCGFSEGKNKSLVTNKTSFMKEVTVQELKAMIDSGADFQLIDVREPHEFDICDLGGELIPQGEIPANVDKISKEKQVVVHCRSGARSGNMVQWLEKTHGFTNLYNLKGGILAWARDIDPSMPSY